MKIFHCPYCGQEKDSATPSEFYRCRFCGFRSALVESPKSGRLLIVDRKMPYLKRRCEDLSSQLTGVTIIVDRRVAQDPHEHPDRRMNGFDEDSGFTSRPRPRGAEMSAGEINSL